MLERVQRQFESAAFDEVAGPQSRCDYHCVATDHTVGGCNALHNCVAQKDSAYRYILVDGNTTGSCRGGERHHRISWIHPRVAWDPHAAQQLIGGNDGESL